MFSRGIRTLSLIYVLDLKLSLTIVVGFVCSLACQISIISWSKNYPDRPIAPTRPNPIRSGAHTLASPPTIHSNAHARHAPLNAANSPRNMLDIHRPRLRMAYPDPAIPAPDKQRPAGLQPESPSPRERPPNPDRRRKVPMDRRYRSSSPRWSPTHGCIPPVCLSGD
jgi:hypothetical protein